LLTHVELAQQSVFVTQPWPGLAQVPPPPAHRFDRHVFEQHTALLAQPSPLAPQPHVPSLHCPSQQSEL